MTNQEAMWSEKSSGCYQIVTFAPDRDTVLEVCIFDVP